MRWSGDGLELSPAERRDRGQARHHMPAGYQGSRRSDGHGMACRPGAQAALSRTPGRGHVAGRDGPASADTSREQGVRQPCFLKLVPGSRRQPVAGLGLSWPQPSRVAGHHQGVVAAPGAAGVLGAVRRVDAGQTAGFWACRTLETQTCLGIVGPGRGLACHFEQERSQTAQICTSHADTPPYAACALCTSGTCLEDAPQLVDVRVARQPRPPQQQLRKDAPGSPDVRRESIARAAVQQLWRSVPARKHLRQATGGALPACRRSVDAAGARAAQQAAQAARQQRRRQGRQHRQHGRQRRRWHTLQPSNTS
eukprot:366486-Chlamydomonas_euryale.AAC.14